MRRVWTVLLLLSLTAGWAQGPEKGAAVDERMEGVVNAPEFPAGLAWLNSPPLKVRELRGKWVLLDFWTYCCINCMHILPELQRLEAKYAEELVVIGVHSGKFQNEKETEAIRNAVLRYEVRHPVVNDAGFDIWNSYAVRAWPSLVLINPLGKVVGQMSGEGVYEPVNAVLERGVQYFESKGQLRRSPLLLTLEEAKRANTLLRFPGKISADAVGKLLVISDSNHGRLLVTNAAGRILHVIGSGNEGRKDGDFAEAEFHHPQGTFLAGDTLYIADTENHLVRVADLKSRTVRTVLGTGEQARRHHVPGQGTGVALNSPWDLLVHDGQLYIAMAGPHQLWVADVKTWQARPYAGSGREGIGDGPLLDAALAQPSGIATDGQRLYFADSETSSVRSADLNVLGRVETIVGEGLFAFGDVDGVGGKVRLQHPLGVAWHDGKLYVADTYNSKIKVIDPKERSSRTLAGTGKKELVNGKLSEAAFREPGGLAWLDGKLYVADTNNHQIRVIDPQAGTVGSCELTGLEVLSRSAPDRFKGRVVDLGEVAVRPEGGELVIGVELPEGYKFNRDAPFFLRWSGQGVEFGLRPEGVDAKNAKLPLRVPLTRVEAGAAVVVDTTVYYCTSEEATCYVDPVRVRVKLRPSGDGAAVVNVAVRAKLPR